MTSPGARLKPHALLDLADENLAESNREFSRWCANGEVVERDGVLMTLGAEKFAALNFLMRTTAGAQPDAATLIDIARKYFSAHQCAFAIRTRAHHDQDLIAWCSEHELMRVANNPGMVIHGPLATEPAPEGIELREARTLEDIEAFMRVCTSSYAALGLPPEIGTRMFEHKHRLLAPHMHFVVAYRGAQPLAGAMALLSHGIGGIYWVGTIPEARGQGLATLCTREVGNWALAQGARAVILQASRQGESIYRAMGYTDFTMYPWFICP
jgi:GNAT superfamily N-acetyltransferase